MAQETSTTSLGPFFSVPLVVCPAPTVVAPSSPFPLPCLVVEVVVRDEMGVVVEVVRKYLSCHGIFARVNLAHP